MAERHALGIFFGENWVVCEWHFEYTARMPEYNYESLSDADFEDLCGDLLAEVLQTRLQRFRRGRDLGIDLLVGRAVNEGLVVQCKHYVRSGFNALLQSIKNSEYPKMKDVDPERYLIATSVGMTPVRKEKLVAAMKPYIHGIDDIFGSEDIDALLRQYPHIEKAHYKLWLTSTEVLQFVINNAAAVWESMENSEIERSLKLYVQTGAYPIAMDILHRLNYVVITGAPGTGKTSLARALCAGLANDKYELLYVRDNIEQAYDLISGNRKQLVVYDDFLGRSSLGDRLGKNEDRGIMQLLRRASSRPGKGGLKIIFTTRDYLLADAVQCHERLDESYIRRGECVVDASGFTRSIKARILYNHLFFSRVPKEHIRSLLRNRLYHKIIDHENYNPRVIEWMTRDDGGADVESGEYGALFMRALSSPGVVWMHAYENQIDDYERALLVVLGSFGGPVEIAAVRRAWIEYVAETADSAAVEMGRKFTRALKTLAGSFVAVLSGANMECVDFANPSIRDFVLQRVAADEHMQSALLRHSLYYEQVHAMLHLNSVGKIDTSIQYPQSGDAVLDKLLAVLPCESVAVTVRYRYPNQCILSRQQDGLGSRLGVLAELVHRTVQNKSEAIFAMWNSISFLVDQCEVDTGAIPMVELLLALVADGHSDMYDRATCLATSINEYLASCDSIDEWLLWGRHLDEYRDVYDETVLEGSEKTVSEFAMRYFGYPGDIEDLGDAETVLQQLEECEGVWGIDLMYSRMELEDHIEALAKAEDRAADVWDDERGAISHYDGDIRTIDDLFDSLDR